jgi:hypothetical protein
VKPSDTSIRPGHNVAFRSEGPSLTAGFLKSVSQSHERFEFLESAHQGGTVCPGTSDGAIKVISAGFGRKLGLGFAANAVPK